MEILIHKQFRLSIFDFRQIFLRSVKQTDRFFVLYK